MAGVRWYEIRRNGAGDYSLFQQGTFAPADGVHRWMGSIAQDKKGDMALGYSVVNGTNVFPGIRYTGRLAGDPLGQMTLGEGTIINGTRRPDHHQLAMGRLHVDERRPRRRLHLLVRQRVLHGRRSGVEHGRLADPHRELQAARLLINSQA